MAVRFSVDTAGGKKIVSGENHRTMHSKTAEIWGKGFTAVQLPADSTDETFTGVWVPRICV